MPALTPSSSRGSSQKSRKSTHNRSRSISAKRLEDPKLVRYHSHLDDSHPHYNPKDFDEDLAGQPKSAPPVTSSDDALPEKHDDSRAAREEEVKEDHLVDSENERDLEKGSKSEDKDQRPEQPKDSNIVSWDGPDDPANPKNWSIKRKWAATVIGKYAIVFPVSSTMIAPALPAVERDLGLKSGIETQMAFSIFVLAYGVGPLLLGPLSELFGRVPVLQLSNLFYFVFNLSCGFAKTGPQMIVCRFLAGIGGSAPQACGGGTLSDCWSSEQRGKAYAIYALMPMLGPAVGPIAGGFIAKYTSWRWVFWSTCIATILVQIAGIFLLQETYAPKLIAKKTKRLIKETGNKNLRSEFELVSEPFSKKLMTAISRPFILLTTQPIVQVLSLYMLYLYGTIYLVISTFPQLWEQKYNMSVEIAGLNYISMLLGFGIATQISARLNDRIYVRLKIRYNGERKPEYRAPVILPGAILTPVGLFWYGWAAQSRVHWILPDIGIFLFTGGTMVCFQAIQTYIVDSYQRYAASAIAATTVLRSVAGFSFPLFAPAMYEKLDYGWGNSVLGFLAIIIGIDGVLVRGNEALHKAHETLKYLNSRHIPFLLLTNGGGYHEEERAGKLQQELGIPINADMIIQSHTPFAGLEELKKCDDGAALVVGGEYGNCQAVARKYGFKHVVTPSELYVQNPNIWPFSRVLSSYHEAAAAQPPNSLTGGMNNLTDPNTTPPASTHLKISSILVFNDPRDWGLDLSLITDLLLSRQGYLGTISDLNGRDDLPNRGYQQDGQPSLFFSNPDLWFASTWHLPRLGQGGFRAALEGLWRGVTGGGGGDEEDGGDGSNNRVKGVELKCKTFGKPSTETFAFAEARLSSLRANNNSTAKDTATRESISKAPSAPSSGGSSPDDAPAPAPAPLKDVVMVGDNPESDIRGANSFHSPHGTRWSSALVRTGVYRGPGPPRWEPTTVVEDVWEAVRWGVDRGGGGRG
ncbi:MAG: hypothetical protein M1831_002867 [Alyxoria varia]|nr:MAG: hypothetical protein M1831_002867 [Alyxoria varia]